MSLIVDGTTGLTLPGSSSGTTVLQAAASASGTLTLPATTDTLVGKATTDTLTNKSIAATQLTGTIAAARLPAGSVAQVVSTAYNTAIVSTSGTLVQIAGLATAITLATNTNKVLVRVVLGCIANGSSTGAFFQLRRGGAQIGSTYAGWFYDNAPGDTGGSMAFEYLDSPASTSALSYDLYWGADANGYSIFLNRTSTNSTNEKGSATMTLMEIVAS